MKVGTKSLLFGAHQFILHPIFVFIAWWKLYGFPKDPRLWIAFIVHDWGYWGKPNMDGKEGETHVELGANIMHRLFDNEHTILSDKLKFRYPRVYYWEWYDFTLYHSRFYAKKNNHAISRLCVADKYAIVIEPWWLYLPRVILSDEIWEYKKNWSKHTGTLQFSHYSWHKEIKEYLRKWVKEHKNNLNDTWTKVDLSPDGTTGFHEIIKRGL